MNNNIWRPHPAVIIKLARDVRGFHLFPFALYRLGMLSQAELEHTLPIAHWPAVTLSRSQVVRQLPAQDLACYIYFQERRRDVVYSFMRDFMDQFKPDSSCQEETSGKCTEAFSRVISHLRDPSIMLMSGPLELPGQALRLAENDRGICTACRESFSRAVKERKMKLWDELPSLFGLADWNTLREASSVAG